MIEWVDVTGSFSEERRHWKERYLEICEVAFDEIECSLFSNKDDDGGNYAGNGVDHFQKIQNQSSRPIPDERERSKLAFRDPGRGSDPVPDPYGDRGRGMI